MFAHVSKVNATQIVGNTIYNVLRMQEIEIGNDDRPTDPPYIKKGEVRCVLPLHWRLLGYNTFLKSFPQAVTNPFSDIVPRDLTPQTGKRKEDPVEQRRRKKARKEYNLLSFGRVDKDPFLLFVNYFNMLCSPYSLLNDDLPPSISLFVRFISFALAGEEAEEEDEENLSKERIKPAHEKLHDDNRLTQESALTESDLKDREANDAGFAIKCV